MEFPNGYMNVYFDAEDDGGGGGGDDGTMNSGGFVPSSIADPSSYMEAPEPEIVLSDAQVPVPAEPAPAPAPAPAEPAAEPEPKVSDEVKQFQDSLVVQAQQLQQRENALRDTQRQMREQQRVYDEQAQLLATIKKNPIKGLEAIDADTKSIFNKQLGIEEDPQEKLTGTVAQLQQKIASMEQASAQREEQAKQQALADKKASYLQHYGNHYETIATTAEDGAFDDLKLFANDKLNISKQLMLNNAEKFANMNGVWPGDDQVAVEANATLGGLMEDILESARASKKYGHLFVAKPEEQLGRGESSPQAEVAPRSTTITNNDTNVEPTAASGGEHLPEVEIGISHQDHINRGIMAARRAMEAAKQEK